MAYLTRLNIPCIQIIQIHKYIQQKIHDGRDINNSTTRGHSHTYTATIMVNVRWADKMDCSGRMGGSGVWCYQS